MEIPWKEVPTGIYNYDGCLEQTVFIMQIYHSIIIIISLYVLKYKFLKGESESIQHIHSLFRFLC